MPTTMTVFFCTCGICPHCRSALANATRAAAEMERLREAVEYAAHIFDAYAGMHDAKGTEDGARKAAANREHAAVCRAALTTEADA